MSTFKAWFFGLVFAVLAVGCAGDPPSYYSIDAEFTEAEAAVIEDVVAAWGEKTGWRPTRVAWADRGRFLLVDTLKGGCEEQEGRECEVTARNDGDNVLVKRASWARGSIDLFWVMMAHEAGHWCADHTNGGVMALRHDADSAQLMTIDDEAVRAWRAGCP